MREEKRDSGFRDAASQSPFSFSLSLLVPVSPSDRLTVPRAVAAAARERERAAAADMLCLVNWQFSPAAWQTKWAITALL